MDKINNIRKLFIGKLTLIIGNMLIFLFFVQYKKKFLNNKNCSFIVWFFLFNLKYFVLNSLGKRFYIILLVERIYTLT